MKTQNPAHAIPQQRVLLLLQSHGMLRQGAEMGRAMLEVTSAVTEQGGGVGKKTTERDRVRNKQITRHTKGKKLTKENDSKYFLKLWYNGF